MNSFEIGFVRLHPDAKVPAKTHESDACYDVWATAIEYMISEEGEFSTINKSKLIVDIDRYGEYTTVVYDEFRDTYYDFYGVIRYRLGFALNLPKDVKVNVLARSSIYKTGLILCNSIATIDEDYTGELMLNFYHVNKLLETYKVGDKIAQLEIVGRNNITFIETDKVKNTLRGEKGFGSTGSK